MLAGHHANQQSKIFVNNDMKDRFFKVLRVIYDGRSFWFLTFQLFGPQALDTTHLKGSFKPFKMSGEPFLYNTTKGC